MFSSTVAFRTLVISSTDIFRVVFKLKRLDIMSTTVNVMGVCCFAGFFLFCVCGGGVGGGCMILGFSGFCFCYYVCCCFSGRGWGCCCCCCCF